MRRNSFVIPFIALLLVPALGHGLTQGQEAPSFQLPIIGGSGTHDLAASRGKVVVIDFWASWCQPCLQAFPDLDRLQQEFGSQAQVLAISIDDDRGAARRALGANRRFIALHDRGGAVARRYGIDGVLPATVVLDKQGRVRLFHRGGTITHGRLRDLVRSLL